MQNQKLHYAELIKEIIILTVAVAIIAAAVFFFLVPSHTSVSSISGLGIVLSNFIPLPLSAITMILNVVLLIIGFLTCGKEFGAKTVYTSILLPLFIGLFELVFPNFSSMTGSQELDVLCYILVVSIGLSILFNRNASSGGLDIVAKILNKYLRMDLGRAMSLSGMCVALSAALVYDKKTVVLSILGTYFNGIILDHFIFDHNKKRRVCIITEKEEALRQFIINELHSGATIYEAIGAYNLQRHNEIITIVDKSEYQRLMTLSRVSRGLPLELSVVQQRLMRLNERLSEVLGPLEGTLNTLKSRLSEISLLEQDSTPTQGETDVSPELKAFLDDLVQTQSRLNTVQVRISRVLGPARKLQENISALCERVSKSIPGLWQDYYLQRSGKIYDMDSWLNIHKSLNALQETFAVRMNAELPWTVAGWIGVILRALVLIIPLHGLIFVSRRLSRTWPESMRTGWNRMCGHSFVWLSFGFMFHFAAWSPSGSYHVLSIVGTLLLSLGQMALAWDLYTFERNDLPLRSPLWPLFAPLLGGLLLLFFNLPGPILGGIWLIMLLVTLWRDYKRAMPDIPFPLVINLLKGQAVILWIAVLMTLIGWGRLSILVCVAYAAVAVCVQFWDKYKAQEGIIE